MASEKDTHSDARSGETVIAAVNSIVPKCEICGETDPALLHVFEEEEEHKGCGSTGNKAATQQHGQTTPQEILETKHVVCDRCIIAVPAAKILRNECHFKVCDMCYRLQVKALSLCDFVPENHNCYQMKLCCECLSSILKDRNGERELDVVRHSPDMLYIIKLGDVVAPLTYDETGRPEIIWSSR